MMTGSQNLAVIIKLLLHDDCNFNIPKVAFNARMS